MIEVIDKKSGIPYYVQIKKDLMDSINKGVYKPGEKIPTENELCNFYSVSRLTVRGAIKELSNDNVLEVIKGKGMFIRPVTLSPLSGIDKIASFSNILNTKGLKVVTKVIELDRVASDDRVSKIFYLAKNNPVIFFKRVRYIEDNPAIVTNAYLKYEICSGITSIDLSKNELFHSIENILGIKINYVKRVIEPALSSSEISDLLNIKKNSPVLYMQTYIFTENNLLFGYLEDFFKKEFSKFEFDMSY